MADGALHSIGIVAEVTPGVTPATPVFQKVRFKPPITLGLSKTSHQSELLRDDRQISDFRLGARKVGGELGIELCYGEHDALLEAAFCGTWATDTPGAGTDRLMAGVTRRSFTVERHFADILDKPYRRYRGVEVASLSLQINADAIVTGSFGLFGIDELSAAGIVVGATYTEPLTTEPVDSFTGVLKIGGTEVAVVTAIQLKLENKIEAKMVVGSKTSRRPSIGRSNITGQVEVFFEDNSIIDDFLNETSRSLEFDLPDGAGNNMKVIIPRFKYTGGQPDVKSEGPIPLVMPFQALRDPTYGSNIVLERTPT